MPRVAQTRAENRVQLCALQNQVASITAFQRKREDFEAYIGEINKEYQLMEYLIRNAGQIISREQITQRVWGYDTDAEYNNVDVYVSFLRKKMKFVQSEAKISSVRGVGYELEAGPV